ncbi:MAG TPA: hypothetical protein VE778_04530 [Candidatus Bathyarchaeia archaeon]|nr:hypothetical protein [Candidatus Bathyarchaeia archaeon]
MKDLLAVAVISGTCVVCGCGGGTPPPPPVPTQLSVVASAAASTAGTPFNITVKAVDASGTVASNYSGTVHSRAATPKQSSQRIRR